MKGTLEFNLPEESAEFKLASTAGEMHSTLWEMDQWLRGQVKYATDAMSEDTICALEECREKLHEFCEVNDVNLDI